MHRTQILLEDEQYERLRLRSRTTGEAIGALVRRAVDEAYGPSSAGDRLRALDDAFGIAATDDFDGLNGEEFVARSRRGLEQRLDDLTSP